MKSSKLFAWSIFVLVLCSTSCSNAPSDDTIKNAITETLKKQVPVSWSGSLMGGDNARIELIQIIDIGKYNENGKFWPVKARVKGTCEANLLVRKELKTFDKTGVFRIYQDDFENWKADLNMFQ